MPSPPRYGYCGPETVVGDALIWALPGPWHTVAASPAAAHDMLSGTGRVETPGVAATADGAKPMAAAAIPPMTIIEREVRLVRMMVAFWVLLGSACLVLL